MVISHSKKFIFIHNYKAAGTSITEALRAYSNPSYSDSRLMDKILMELGLYPKLFSSDFNAHSTAEELKNTLPEPIFSSYFKFGFVRNPWDWQVSLYTYMLRSKHHHQHELISRMKGFDEYIDWRVNKELRLQKPFFYDSNNNCLVDHIGRFEELDLCANELFRRFGIRRGVPHLNRSRTANDFLAYYNSRTLQVVAEAFKEDIETFGYTMPDGGSVKADAMFSAA